MKQMKRFILATVLALSASMAMAVSTSTIQWNGSIPDQGTLMTFLNNPTFSTMTVSGTPSIITTPRLKNGNIEIGPVALASIGTNTADVAGQLWVTDINIPISRTITKIGFLQGGTATTDNVLVAIYNSSGTLLGTSALTGVVLSGANTFQEQTLLTPVALNGPGVYFIAVQGNGTAVGAIQTLASPNFMNRTSVISGTFGTVPATITPPTTWTTGQGPVVYVY